MHRLPEVERGIDKFDAVDEEFYPIPYEDSDPPPTDI